MTDQFAKNLKKGYCTGDSQAVTHPSTNPACGCLTSEIERDRVHSTEYGRIRHSTISNSYIPCSFLKLPTPTRPMYWISGRKLSEMMANTASQQCTHFWTTDWEWQKHCTAQDTHGSPFVIIFDLLLPSRWEGRPKGSVTGLRREPVEH